MVSVNPLTREIFLKIVYYGPGLGGKTTTLQYIHETTDPQHCGKMVSLDTPVERTLYFDYLPVRLPEIGGYALKLQLFTVPGQIHFNATRKLVLSNADGVVFVADSQRSRYEANLESYDNLLFNLSDYGVNTDDFPIIFQYNKRDLIDIASIADLDRDLNRKKKPSLGTDAVKGTNIYEALELITKEVLRNLKRKGVTPSVSANQNNSDNDRDNIRIEESKPQFSEQTSENTVKIQLKNLPVKALPLEDAVSKIADRTALGSQEYLGNSGVSYESKSAILKNKTKHRNSSSPYEDTISGIPISEEQKAPKIVLERPTIPAPFAVPNQVFNVPSTSNASLNPSASVLPRFTFVPIWPEQARKRGIEIETAICERRYLDAARLIASEIDLIISIHRRDVKARSATTVIALLGLDSVQYRDVLNMADKSASEITLSNVLFAYLYLLQVIEKSR